MSETQQETRQEAPRRAVKIQQERRENTKLDVDVEQINPDLYALNGQLGQDPELRYTPGGKAVCNLSVAYDVRERKGKDWISVGTMWVRVNVWGKLAENCAEYLSTGDRVVVIGTWNHTTWDDKDTGETRHGVEMNARDVGFSQMFADKKATRDGENKF
jgi:single-strand DNA-binding protein